MVANCNLKWDFGKKNKDSHWETAENKNKILNYLRFNGFVSKARKDAKIIERIRKEGEETDRFCAKDKLELSLLIIL